jgi:peroxiredoxin-like protein
MEVRSKVYTYRTAVKWTEQKKGTITCEGKPDIQVATPPEFKGHEGIWSPEDLYVASANICLMTTFLAVAERAGLTFTSYHCEAEGRLELVEGKFQVTVITLRPQIALQSGSDAAKAKELIEKAEANCLISNSMKTRIALEPTIPDAPDWGILRQPGSSGGVILSTAIPAGRRVFPRIGYSHPVSLISLGCPFLSDWHEDRILIVVCGVPRVCGSSLQRRR